MMEIRRYDDIMEQAIAGMIANQDRITDFNKGSIIHTFLDTVARIAERIYIAIRQGYKDNLRMVPYSLFKFTRKTGLCASGTVEFQREKPIPTRTVIQKSTRISGGGKTYLTTSTGYIEPNSLFSNPVQVTAEKPGRDYNVPSFAIDTIDSIVPTDVASVTNNNSMTGGTDMESENEFDERFKIYLNGLSGTNNYAIMNAALNLPEVRSVSVKNHNPPLQNIYNMSIYIDCGDGTASSKTIETVRLEVEGNGTAQHQGHLAPGVNVRIMEPLIVPVVFESVFVEVFRADLSIVDMEVRNILAEYVNSLTIGKSVIISEVIARLMRLPYIRDVKIPKENIDIQSDQILRFSKANVIIRESGNA